MEYAIAHHFQRNSVVDFHDLAVTAMERSMGGALPEDFKAGSEAAGRAVRAASEVTTREVLGAGTADHRLRPRRQGRVSRRWRRARMTGWMRPVG